MWQWLCVTVFLSLCSFLGRREKKKKEKDDDDEEEDFKKQQVPRMYLTFKGLCLPPPTYIIQLIPAQITRYNTTSTAIGF